MEAEIDKMLTGFRAQQTDFLGPSFGTIAAYMENAACMHYSPAGLGAEIKNEGFLLVDSGGQYLDGTIDITRTIAVGPVTEEMKRNYTLVLKGHIALASVKFPYGTTGSLIDALARVPLWSQGMNYNHGTGHGIGFCLSVHEGPQGIAAKASSVKLEEGMLLSNEPGLYIEGQYGIRTENTVLVRKHSETGFGKFLCFETVSPIPLELDAVDTSLLTDEEGKWLDGYNTYVYKALSPYMTEDEREWLKKATMQV
jgi:Xaa-Pro aminopeptidase